MFFVKSDLFYLSVRLSAHPFMTKFSQNYDIYRSENLNIDLTLRLLGTFYIWLISDNPLGWGWKIGQNCLLNYRVILFVLVACMDGATLQWRCKRSRLDSYIESFGMFNLPHKFAKLSKQDNDGDGRYALGPTR